MIAGSFQQHIVKDREGHIRELKLQGKLSRQSIITQVGT